jgi:hypothetical protein
MHPYGWGTGHFVRMKEIQINVSTRTPGGGSGGQGLLGEYFANRDCAGAPKFTRVDSDIKFIWGTDSPGQGMPNENFSVRWTGQIQPRYSEPYVFCGNRDDGVRVWIDDRLIVDQWSAGDFAPFASNPVTLTANRRYNIRVEYLQLQGPAKVDLRWKSPSQREETIPYACLFRASAGQIGANTRDSDIQKGKEARPPADNASKTGFSVREEAAIMAKLKELEGALRARKLSTVLELVDPPLKKYFENKLSNQPQLFSDYLRRVEGATIFFLSQDNRSEPQSYQGSAQLFSGDGSPGNLEVAKRGERWFFRGL